ncbi:proteoglycan 4-like [Morone saxatilis]|uniref:proteoglycan 4-like n=1 Tax=Morone saxatilis TaxID=34816 RepID=UPI0015E23C6E|nr:proteoglycan 4-like [Morone saxatilis]
MACRESRDTRVLLVVGLFLFASSFCLCTRLTKLKELVELRGNSMLSQGHHKGSELRRGRLLIGQKSLQGAKLKGTKTTKNLLDADTDYQADMGWGQPKPAKGWDDGFSRLRSDDATVERLLKMEPKVECTANSMKLQVQDAASTPGSLLFVDRGRHLSPLPLSKLPTSCGYTIRLTQRDLVLAAPYDGCFVDLQEDNYILPLRWLGLPVKMSCPVLRQSSPNPPMVTCHAEGMVVKVEWTISVSKIKVNLNGTWEPLMKASPRCGFSVVVHPEGVVVSVRYTPCLEKKDGMYTLELAGDGETKVSCPFLSPAQPQPIKSPKIPVSEDPLGQIYQQPQPEVPQGQVYQPFYPQTDSQPATQPTAVPKPPQPEAPQGQIYQPFYPNPFYPHPFYPQLVPKPQPATKPPQPQQPEAPQGQVYQPFYPQPESQPVTKPTAVPKPPQPEAPRGQVYQPFYPHPFYPQPVPEPQPATKPPQPQQPEAPQRQVYQSFFPNLYYSQPEPEKLPAAKLPAVPKPPAREMPIGHVQKPSYPKPFKIPGAGTNGQTAPTEKPAQSEQPPAVKPQEGQVPSPFKPYYQPQQPQQPQQPVTLPPATSMQQPQQVITPDPGQNTMESAKPQPSKSDMVPKNPLLGSAHMPPVYCPQSCPSGFSNCCPQIAFHQHLHHIVPAGPGSKDTPPIYAGLPFLPSVAYSGFGSGFGSAPFPQEPTEAVTTQAPTTSTSAAILPQSLPSGNEKRPYLQPLDGNPGALPRSNPSKPTNPIQTIYPYFVPNSLYPNWPYQLQSQELQNLPYIASPPHYGVPSTPQGQGNKPVNPMVQFEPYNMQPLQQQNSKPSAEARSFLKQFLPLPPSEKGQNTPTAKELPPSNQKAIDYKGQTHPKVQSDLDHHLVPYYMLQDAEATTYNKSTVLNNSTQTRPFVSDSKKSTSHEQGYVLLQHGPPGREPNSFHQSPLPVRDLVYDANFLAQSFARHHSKLPNPQNFRPPQQKTQHPKWLSKGMANPIPGNVNYMPRLGEESENLPVLFSASDGSHFVPLPQDPTFNGAHLRPKFSNSFKDLWKPMTPLGSGIPPHVPGKAFQGWRSAADHEGNGLNQPIQKEGGNRK